MQISEKKRDLETQQNENKYLREQFDLIQQEFVRCRSEFTSAEEQENIRLKARYEELSSRFRNANERKSRLVRKSMNRTNVVETHINKDEKVEHLKSRLRNLIEENHILDRKSVV